MATSIRNRPQSCSMLKRSPSTVTEIRAMKTTPEDRCTEAICAPVSPRRLPVRVAWVLSAYSGRTIDQLTTRAVTKLQVASKRRCMSHADDITAPDATSIASTLARRKVRRGWGGIVDTRTLMAGAGLGCQGPRGRALRLPDPSSGFDRFGGRGRTTGCGLGYCASGSTSRPKPAEAAPADSSHHWGSPSSPSANAPPMSAPPMARSVRNGRHPLPLRALVVVGQQKEIGHASGQQHRRQRHGDEPAAPAPWA
jgi:hypothetical protein